MKKIFTTLSLALLITPGLVFAQSTNFDSSVEKFTRESAQEAGYDISTPVTGLATLGGKIVAAFLSLIGIIFISYTLYGGYLWMTAGGNEERVTKARAIIRNGIIGMIIVFSVYGIYLVVAAIFNPDIQSYTTSGF